MLGADHHGYIGRMRAMAACFGDDPDEHLEIRIGQMVNLLRNGEPLRMSKRAGTVLTLEDFVEALGVDAARYALARYSLRLADRHRHRPVDPGHPRQPGLLRAVRRGPHRERWPATPPRSGSAAARPTTSTRAAPAREGERPAQGARASYPAVVASAAELREPHRVARYLEELAGAYHRFYDAVPGAAAGRRADHRSAARPALAHTTPPGR